MGVSKPIAGITRRVAISPEVAAGKAGVGAAGAGCCPILGVTAGARGTAVGVRVGNRATGVSIGRASANGKGISGGAAATVEVAQELEIPTSLGLGGSFGSSHNRSIKTINTIIFRPHSPVSNEPARPQANNLTFIEFSQLQNRKTRNRQFLAKYPVILPLSTLNTKPSLKDH
jgi:hypothetical protein